MRQRSAALLLSLPLVLAMTTSAGAAPPGDKGRPDSAGKATVSTSVSADVGAGHGNGQGNGQGNANGHAKGHANGQAKADAGASASTSSSTDKHGTATSGPLTSPQPLSNADMNGTGANPGASCTHAYCSTRDGSASENGKGEGAAVGKPCAGCVGKADNKNPPGQAPNGSDANSGYECDANQGIGKGNPAHTGCKATVAAPVPTPTKTPAVTAQVTPTPTPTQTTTTTTTVTTTTTPAPTPSPTQTTTVVTVTTPPAPVPAVTATATATATATTPPASPAATVTASPSPIGGSTGQPASSPTPVPTGAAGGGAVETPAAPSQGGGIGGGSESPATAGESSGLPFTGTAITVLAAGALVLLVLGGTLQLLARRRDHALSGQD